MKRNRVPERPCFILPPDERAWESDVKWCHEVGNEVAPFDITGLMERLGEVRAVHLAFIQSHYDKRREDALNHHKEAEEIVRHFFETTLKKLCTGEYERRWNVVMVLRQSDYHDSPFSEEEDLLIWMNNPNNIKGLPRHVCEILVQRHGLHARVGEKLLHPGLMMMRDGEVVETEKAMTRENLSRARKKRTNTQRKNKDEESGSGGGAQTKRGNTQFLLSGYHRSERENPSYVRFLYVNWHEPTTTTPSTDEEGTAST